MQIAFHRLASDSSQRNLHCFSSPTLNCGVRWLSPTSEKEQILESDWCTDQIFWTAGLETQTSTRHSGVYPKKALLSLCHPQSLGVDWFFQKSGGWATRSTLLPTWLGLDALSSFVKGAGQCWLLQKLTPVSKSKEENTDSWPRSHEPSQLCGLAHCQSITGRTHRQTQRQGGLDTRANQKKSFPERTRRDS